MTKRDFQKIEYDAEHRQKNNIQTISPYEALRNMFMRLKTPTMNGYPEIGEIKHIMEEALKEWRQDKNRILDLTSKIIIDKYEEKLKDD